MDIFAKEVAALIDASLSTNTKQLYKRALDSFQIFRDEYGLQNSWPPTVAQLINFIAYLSSKNCAYATANVYLSGISFYLKIQGLPDYTQSFIIRKLLCGLRRSRPVKDVRAPITLQILFQLPLALSHVASSTYEALLFSAAFVIAFFGFFRVGEITTVSQHANSSKVVQLSDVTFESNECYVRIKCSKTDQFAHSVTLVFTESTIPAMCPVRLLRQYIAQRPKQDGPLFCHFSGLPVTKYQFRQMIFKCLNFLGMNRANIKCHSFRIGAATTAYLQNIPEETIKQLGRWSSKSNTHKKYIRLEKIIP